MMREEAVKSYREESAAGINVNKEKNCIAYLLTDSANKTPVIADDASHQNLL